MSRMIRSTRVFVPKSIVKDVDGTIGLKSSDRNILERGGYRDDWFRLVDDSGERLTNDDSLYKSRKNNNFLEVIVLNQYESIMKDFNPESVESVSRSTASKEKTDKMYGIVYQRKRRKLTGERFISSSNIENERVSEEDRMFGIQFSRKQPNKKLTKSFLQNKATSLVEIKREEEAEEMREHSIIPHLGVVEKEEEVSLSFISKIGLSFVIDSSSCNVSQFISLLCSILSFMRKSRLRLSLLAAFMSSEPISQVFSLHGIQLLQYPLSEITCKEFRYSSSGICMIQGRLNSVPLFNVDFLAIPLTFIRLHSIISLQSQFPPHCLVTYLKCLLAKTHEVTYRNTGSELDITGTSIMGSGSSLKKRNVNQITGGSELPLISSNVPRKRSSVRSGRVNFNPLSLVFYSDILDSDADFFSSADGWNSSYAIEPKQKKRKFPSKNLSDNTKQKSSVVKLRQKIDVLSCSANILVIERDKCRREEGARVMLECSLSKDWFVVIKKQGLIRYSYKANDLAWTFKTNRFTLAMVWTGETDWNLEFPDRRDWVIFKELHRKCIDENLKVASSRPIPVPLICEVPDYKNSEFVPFVRPDVYISMHVDEVTRALTCKGATYMADSADEEWLGKLNSNLDGDGKVSAEKFEEIIDAFEKTAFCSSDNTFDESKAVSLCSDLARELVSALYQYWLEKRKQNCSPLLRVFQSRPPKNTQSEVFDKPVLRKRRSMKRQRQPGRGKQRSFLQVFDSDKVKEDDNIRRIEGENVQRAQKETMRVKEDQRRVSEEADTRRIEEANKSASETLEVAIMKRQRAQTLMEYADLAAYWATMAVKIAEAAQIADSAEVAFSLHLDD